MKSNEELIEQYYRENPDVEVKHRNSALGELLIPSGIGALAGKVLKNNALAGAGYGIGISAPLYATRRALRNKKILEEMGVEESILGSFLEPYKSRL